MNRSRSHQLYSRAQELMPGGVNSAARAFGAVGGEPIVIEQGKGPFLFDVDGNRYIDYIGSWGPMILGHQFPKVSQALEDAIQKGTSYGAPTEAENELAELIIQAVPSVEMVRMVSSGTEATMSAIRLARGYTKRDLIVKFAGNYHGHVDSLLVAAGSAGATLSVPNSPGVTQATGNDTLVLEYNDVTGFERAIQSQGSKIACVIMEGVCGNMGCVTPTPDFLSSVRSLTEQHGILLIFDEVMCGFRVAYAGAQSILGVTPDLTTMGKIVGGGLPLGVFGGKKEIMNHILPAGKVFQAGTLSGNPIATAAGIATLKELRDNPPYERLEQLSKRLADGLCFAAEKAGIDHQLNRVGSMLTLFFTNQPVTSWTSASQCNTSRFAEYFWGLMDRGIYMPCSQFEALFVSSAHSETLIDQTLSAAAEVLSDMSTR
jgi:glutamate-1-semialdehyde 2,1-aminomutase